MGAGASSASPGNTKAAVIGELPEGPAVPHTALEHGNELPAVAPGALCPQSVPKDFKPMSLPTEARPPREMRRRRVTDSHHTVFNDELSTFIRRYMRGEELLTLTASGEAGESAVASQAPIPTVAASSAVPRQRAAAQQAIAVALDYFCFAACTEDVKNQFVAALKEETFLRGEYVYHQDDPGDKLHIVEEGRVDLIVGSQCTGTASVGEVFGELSLIYGTRRPASALVVSDRVVLWSLGQANFRRLQASISMESLGLSFRSAQRGRTKSQASRWVPLDVRLNELVHVATIGLGSFGFVDMVCGPSEAGAADGPVYALKRVSKQFVCDRGFERKIVQEKETLAQLDSPFVLKLLRTFQDDRWLYLLTEIALGGDLMELMCDGDKLDDATIRFLALCLAEALHVVHENGFIHRDVKPENCLIGADGYLKLADFSLAKPLPCLLDIGNGRVEAVGISYTMCGSPEFMAPECVLSLGYDRTADYWAFGCLLYELFFGKNPFDHSGNLKATFVAVASIGLGKTAISFPPEAAGTNEWGEDLLQRLLVCKSRRIVSPHVFGHPFLESLDINQLRRKEIVAPFRPVLRSSTDTSRFAMPAPEDLIEAPIIGPLEPDPFASWCGR